MAQITLDAAKNFLRSQQQAIQQQKAIEQQKLQPEADPLLDLKRQLMEQQVMGAQIENEAAANPFAAPNIPAGQIAPISDAESTIEQIKQAQQLLATGRADTGGSVKVKRLLGKVGLGPEKLRGIGVNITPEEQQLDAVLTNLKANYLKFLSGAAVSEQEFERLSRSLPDASDTQEQIKMKLQILQDGVSRNLANVKRNAGVTDPMQSLMQMLGGQAQQGASPTSRFKIEVVQ